MQCCTRFHAHARTSRPRPAIDIQRRSPITPEMLSIPPDLLLAVYTEAEALELTGMVRALESAGVGAEGARGKLTQAAFNELYRDSFNHPYACKGGVGKCADACAASDAGHFKPLRPLRLCGMNLASKAPI